MTTPFSLPVPERVLLVGDLHANLTAGRAVIEHAAAVGAEVIVQVGDFGFFPLRLRGRTYLAGMDHWLAAFSLKLVFVDGNHDDHDSLAGLPRGSDGIGQVSNTIGHLPRGHRWDWGGNTWLALGGAPSLDKLWRTIGVDWWPQEEVSYQQAAAAIEAGPVDVVVAHDSPWIEGGVLYRKYGQDVPATQRIGGGWPTDALVASDAHQKLMRGVLDAATPRLWVNGHHHHRFTAHAGQTTVESLGMDAQPLRELCLLVDPAGNRIPAAG